MPVNSGGVIKPLPNSQLRSWFGEPHQSGYPAVVVPILGRVQFHLRVAEAFLQVWRDIDAAHLGGLVDMNDWRESGGTWCYRHILHNSANPLSPHSWANCVDFNVCHIAGPDGKEKQISGTNYGNSHLAPSLVKLAPFFESYGFTWGGRWGTPDGMHFESTEITCQLLEGATLSAAAQAAVDKARAARGPAGALGLGIVILPDTLHHPVPCNPVENSGAVSVDLRPLAEALGARVTWDGHAPGLLVDGQPVDISAWCEAPASGPTRCPLGQLLAAVGWRVKEPPHLEATPPRIYVEREPA